MKQIWSPWRMKYILSHERSSECIFCHALEDPSNDALNLVLFRGKKAFVILNRYPYTSGHLMVVPNAHEASLTRLDAATSAELMALLQWAEHVLRQVYHPDGLNLGLNLGAAAGAGVVGHIHFHVVPRWEGDTNFMTAVGDARVLPESLEDTYQRLRAAWRSPLEPLPQPPLKAPHDR